MPLCVEILLYTLRAHGTSLYFLTRNHINTVIMAFKARLYLVCDLTKKVLSKTQAHEIVVPWQHEAVAEEEAVSGEGKGNKEEAVLDVGNGDETGEV